MRMKIDFIKREVIKKVDLSIFHTGSIYRVTYDSINNTFVDFIGVCVIAEEEPAVDFVVFHWISAPQTYHVFRLIETPPLDLDKMYISEIILSEYKNPMSLELDIRFPKLNMYGGDYN